MIHAQFLISNFLLCGVVGRQSAEAYAARIVMQTRPVSREFRNSQRGMHA
jgi:hypothetical protein